MAKKSKEEAEVVAADDDYDEDDELELLQVDVGDMIKLKQILDETVASAVLEKLEEDYRLDNFKLIIMVSACAFAMAAQFAPIPFPESRPLLGVCCCVYFLLSGLLQLITTFIDKDAILITKPLPKNEKNKDLEKYGVRVRSIFPRFSEFYTVILEFQGLDHSPYVEQKWSVGQFFDKEGMFDEVGLGLEVESLYNRLAQGKYDDSKKDKKD